MLRAPFPLSNTFCICYNTNMRMSLFVYLFYNAKKSWDVKMTTYCVNSSRFFHFFCVHNYSTLELNTKNTIKNKICVRNTYEINIIYNERE